MLMFRLFIKWGCNDIALYGASHVGDFFRSLIDQKNDEVTLGVAFGDRVGKVLQDHGLTGFRRRDDQGALAFAYRSNEIHNTTGKVFGGAISSLKLPPRFWEKGCQVGKQDLVFGIFRWLIIDLFDLEHGEVTLTFLWGANLA